MEPKPTPKLDEGENNFATIDLDETLEQPNATDEGFFAADSGEGLFPAINYRYYPHVYTGKIVLTLLVMLLVWPGYRTFPFRVSWLSVAVGVVGVVLWVGLCHLQLEPKIIGPIDRLLGSLVQFATRFGSRRKSIDWPNIDVWWRPAQRVQSAATNGRFTCLGLHVSGNSLRRFGPDRTGD